VIGVPGSPGAIGWGLLIAGVLAGAVAFPSVWRRVSGRGLVVDAALCCLVVTTAVAPYLVWRFVQDLRYTTRLDAYDAEAAGPIQAYMPGYLVNGAGRYVPRNATYSVVVGERVPWPQARAAFPALVQQRLFPRRSVADPRAAGYVVTWGVDPAAVVDVKRVWIVRRRYGSYLAVYVGQVNH
jgi:hypothetical protein